VGFSNLEKKGKRMFSVDQKVVYPGHGVAVIERIVEKSIGGCPTRFFELKFLSKDMTILVPVDNAPSVGLRELSSSDVVQRVLAMLSKSGEGVQSEAALANWNKRNKDYQGKIRKGDLKEICEIYRDLKQIENFKELSFGEKNLLAQTEALLVEEIAQASNISDDRAIEILRTHVAPISRARAGMSREIQK
jgi:CarD family transcriptional regulator